MIVPERTSHSRDQEVRLLVDIPTARRVRIHHLDRVIADVAVDGGVACIAGLPLGGYGASALDADDTVLARTAFDVLDDPFDRPRYGFVTRMDESDSLPEMSLLYRRLHLSIAQFYDWAYRHSTLMPPTDDYVDALGQRRSLRAINTIAGGLSDIGTVPLGYSAVYAIGADEIERWSPHILRREDGAPYRLGEDFLVLVDAGDEEWLRHYTTQLREVLAHTRLEGFHLDQYGWPKFARTARGRVDVAASFVTMLETVRAEVPEARFMFNNVNDFGTRETAGSAQDASYIEVWSPHDTLQDLADLVARTRALRPDHPPIISAYLTCFADSLSGGVEAALCTMAALYSSGGTHLLLGDTSHALIDPYYPRNAHLDPLSVDAIVPWYDFLVRYGDLLMPAGVDDVSEFYTGGINDDVVIDAASHRVSTKAVPDSLWVRVFRTPDGSHVVHIINLLGLDEIDWDHAKPPVAPLEGVALTVASGLASAGAYCASPGEPDLLPLSGHDAGRATQSDALSAGQEHVSFLLPSLGRWTLVWLPADADPSEGLR